jgi:hypothetical protein
MKIKFLADENLRQAIVLGLRRREPSVNFVQAYEARAKGKDDPTVLQIAAEQTCDASPKQRCQAPGVRCWCGGGYGQSRTSGNPARESKRGGKAARPEGGPCAT